MRAIGLARGDEGVTDCGERAVGGVADQLSGALAERAASAQAVAVGPLLGPAGLADGERGDAGTVGAATSRRAGRSDEAALVATALTCPPAGERRKVAGLTDRAFRPAHRRRAQQPTVRAGRLSARRARRADWAPDGGEVAGLGLRAHAAGGERALVAAVAQVPLAVAGPARDDPILPAPSAAPLGTRGARRAQGPRLFVTTGNGLDHPAAGAGASQLAPPATWAEARLLLTRSAPGRCARSARMQGRAAPTPGRGARRQGGPP